MWGVEWLLNRILDVSVPPLGVLLLIFWAPVLGVYNIIARNWNWIRSPSMRGKSVLITGASSGIGEHIAYEFAKRGARLVLTGERGERLRHVAQACERMGAEDYATCEGDVLHEPDCHRMVETAINRFGRLDVLVNNAGVSTADLFKDMQSFEPMRRVVDVDFFGYVWMTLHALPYLRRNQGYILVNASVAAFTPVPRHNVYNAAKGAVVQFFDTMRTEPAGRDVSITIAFPGATASELTAGKFIDATGKMVVDQEKRDILLGPQPMLRTSTVAARMVSAMLARGHYAIVPFWFTLGLLFRTLAPELLYLSLRWNLMPWAPGTQSPAKIIMDTVGAPKMLFHPPATSQEEAEAALYEGKATGARPAEAGGVILEKASQVVKGLVQSTKQQAKAPSPEPRAVKA